MYKIVCPTKIFVSNIVFFLFLFFSNDCLAMHIQEKQKQIPEIKKKKLNLGDILNLFVELEKALATDNSYAIRDVLSQIQPWLKKSHKKAFFNTEYEEMCKYSIRHLAAILKKIDNVNGYNELFTFIYYNDYVTLHKKIQHALLGVFFKLIDQIGDSLLKKNYATPFELLWDHARYLKVSLFAIPSKRIALRLCCKVIATSPMIHSPYMRKNFSCKFAKVIERITKTTSNSGISFFYDDLFSGLKYDTERSYRKLFYLGSPYHPLGQVMFSCIDHIQNSYSDKQEITERTCSCLAIALHHIHPVILNNNTSVLKNWANKCLPQAEYLHICELLDLACYYNTFIQKKPDDFFDKFDKKDRENNMLGWLMSFLINALHDDNVLVVKKILKSIQKKKLMIEFIKLAKDRQINYMSLVDYAVSVNAPQSLFVILLFSFPGWQEEKVKKTPKIKKTKSSKKNSKEHNNDDKVFKELEIDATTFNRAYKLTDCHRNWYLKKKLLDFKRIAILLNKIKLSKKNNNSRDGDNNSVLDGNIIKKIMAFAGSDLCLQPDRQQFQKNIGN